MLKIDFSKNVDFLKTQIPQLRKKRFRENFTKPFDHFIALTEFKLELWVFEENPLGLRFEGCLKGFLRLVDGEFISRKRFEVNGVTFDHFSSSLNINGPKAGCSVHGNAFVVNQVGGDFHDRSSWHAAKQMDSPLKPAAAMMISGPSPQRLRAHSPTS